jgi:hypothetical protein
MRLGQRSEGDYRAYLIGIDGHITDVRLLQASGDAAAWKAAVQLKIHTTLELWCADREVPQLRH